MVLSEIPHNANKVNLVARDPCNTKKKVVSSVLRS